ncbi:MAG TPA: O-succinylhomoserine sulfhydrylase [Actinobacteria bacterium]|nr:O-succinylhomoserine sulfhydrylase [bacterium BMS3Bbin02]HDL41839.1 O-succinylhomoserine sulfhydrylase [Actinomycetota bacterium]
MSSSSSFDSHDDHPWRPATLQVRGGLSRSAFDETSEGLFLTSGYVYGSAAEAQAAFEGDIDRYIYSRYGNPTVGVFEERLRLIEGAEVCKATATGMAAVFAALACRLDAGDRVVASRALFGSCKVVISDILPRWGIETVLVDGTDLDAWERELATPADVVFFESPSNPTLEIIDIAAVSERAHAGGATVVVDNVFASPVVQSPLALGADIVVYSTTKHIDGQGRTLGGAVLASQQFIDDHFQLFYRHTGPAMSPFNAWVALKGLETLDLRVRAQSASALAVAQWLDDHGAVATVRHPFLASHPQRELAERQMSTGGTVVTFTVEGGTSRAFEIVDALTVFDISNNLGDTKSLVTHPGTTTHRMLTPEERFDVGLADGTIRLSIGLEDVADLIEDLDRALVGRGGSR